MSEFAYEIDDRSLAEISGGKIDFRAYGQELQAKLDLRTRLMMGSMSILRHAAKLTEQGTDFAAKISPYGERAPVAPALPEVRARLAAAVIEHAPDISLIELLAVYEALLKEAEDYYQ